MAGPDSSAGVQQVATKESIEKLEQEVKILRDLLESKKTELDVFKTALQKSNDELTLRKVELTTKTTECEATVELLTKARIALVEYQVKVKSVENTSTISQSKLNEYLKNDPTKGLVIYYHIVLWIGVVLFLTGGASLVSLFTSVGGGFVFGVFITASGSSLILGLSSFLGLKSLKKELRIHISQESIAPSQGQNNTEAQMQDSQVNL